MYHVDEVFSFTSQVRFYGVRFSGRKEGICSKSVRNVGTGSTVFSTKIAKLQVFSVTPFKMDQNKYQNLSID